MNGNTIAYGNSIRDNAHNGVSGARGDYIYLDNNKIYNNNTLHDDPGWDASAVKFVGTKDAPFLHYLYMRNNHIYNNYGQGLWCDGNCYDVHYEGNLIHDNYGAAIDHEISWTAYIAFNTMFRNMLSEQNLNKSCAWGGEIISNNSQHVYVYNNQIKTYAANAICFSSTDRPDPYNVFPKAMGDVKVYNNKIHLSVGSHLGMAGDPSVMSFYNNSYFFERSDFTFFHISNLFVDWNGWRSRGQDAGSTYVVGP